MVTIFTIFFFVFFFVFSFVFSIFPLCIYFLKLGDYSVIVQVAKGRVTPQVFKLRLGESI